jgi:hypothetical protein
LIQAILHQVKLTCGVSEVLKNVNGVVVEMTEQESSDWVASLPVANPIPQRVTALQGLLAIDEAGLSSAYQEWATSESRTFAERAFIDKATHWNRTDPVLISGAEALGLTSEQIDSLFISAAGK